MDILLTGSSRGLGEALCRRLLKHGHRVWGVARNAEALKTLEHALGSDRFRWSLVDVADQDSINAWRDEVEHEQFHPNCLVLNASVLQDDMLQNYDAATAARVIETNLTGALLCMGAFFPMLKETKGRIVGITSTVALRPSIRSASYAASKAGLRMALRSMRLRYKNTGMTFAEVCMGPVATDMWEGKKNWMVPTAEEAAGVIAGFVEGKGKILYYPVLSTTLLRMSMCLPDSVFAAVSHKVMK